MASIIQIKRSSGVTAPTTTALVEGELAYSEDRVGDGANAKLYIESVASDNTTPVIDVIGGKFYTAAIDAATNANTVSTIVKRDGSGNFSAGTITAALSGTASTATALATGRTIAITGDLTYTSPSFDGSGNVTAAGTLSTVNSNVGSFGGTTAIPVITVDGKGRITAVSTAAVAAAGGFTIAGNTGTDVFGGGETLTFTGSTGVTTAVTDNTVTISIGQAVGTGSNVSFNDLTLAGNLTVNGTVTTLNTTNTVVTDLLMELGNGVTGAPVNDSGIVIERGDSDNAFIGFDESVDKFIVGTGTFTGASTGNLTITVGTLLANLEGNVTGGTVSSLSADIAVADGGTGAGTFTTNGILYGNGTSALQATAAGTTGYFLYSNAGTPDWTNVIDGGTY